MTTMMYAPTSSAMVRRWKPGEMARSRIAHMQLAMLALVALIIAQVRRVVSETLDELRYSPVARQRLVTLAVVALMVMIIAAPHIAHGQSFNIDFCSEDLDVFFEWFNTMFGILLPIALIGAGIVAGGMFVWVVAGMLQRAFTSMLGGLRSR